MSQVTLEALVKTFRGASGAVTAIDHVDLQVEQGEMLVLLGPSGCGKTTILRCLAGLEHPDAGRISLGAETVYDRGRGINLPPERRDIGMVFQSYALWPNKTVRRNIEFPLKVRKVDAPGRVEETASLVDCSHLLDRYPAQLSGGQQQRVAVARGVVTHPGLLLMDEPLSNLDARLRDQVRTEIHSLHRELGFTSVYVTHDQTEAMALGDRIAVMCSGSIEQLATPQEIYRAPSSPYVAEFVGYLSGFDAVRADGELTCSLGAIDGGERLTPAMTGSCHLRFRPDDGRPLPAGGRIEGWAHIDGFRVTDVSYMGRHFEVAVERDGVTLRVVAPCRGATAEPHVAPGGPVTVAIDPDGCLAYPTPTTTPTTRRM